MHDEHRGQSTSLGCGGRVYSKSWDQGSHGTSDQSDASLNWTFHVYHPTKQSVHSSRKIVYSYLDQPLALQYKGKQLPVNTTFRMDLVRLWFGASRCHSEELLSANAGAVFKMVFGPRRKQI